MLSKSLKMIALIGFLSVFFSSCSTDDEIFEEQKPKSKFSNLLRQKLALSTNGNQEALKFQQQTNWYENFEPTNCGIESMLLAYEAFNNQGVSLNEIIIFPWEVSDGTLLSVVNDIESYLSGIYQQDVNVVFVSGVLFKINSSTGNAEYAKINSYTLFLDYFQDCQSSQVIFQPYNGTTIDWDLFLLNPVDDVIFPEPTCYSLVFPLQILVVEDTPTAQPFTVTVNETEFLNFINGENPNLIVIDFVYPISLISTNGTTVNVNNIQELEQLFEQPCN